MTLCIRDQFEKIIVYHVKNPPPSFYLNRRFITCSQKLATGPYPEPDESSPHPPVTSYKMQETKMVVVGLYGYSFGNYHSGYHLMQSGR
jgi:hypothetical protein